MPQMIYFDDGTSESLFEPDETAQFARILGERLGPDAERTFLRLIRAAPGHGGDTDRNYIERLSAYVGDLKDEIADLEDQVKKLEYQITQLE